MNPPMVKPEQLLRFLDAASLRDTYPHGYRLNGPLIAARPGTPAISLAAVELAIEEMDQQELAAYVFSDLA